MTSILIVATAAVLVFLGLSCRRARLDLQEQLCDCLEPPVPAAVGYGGGTTARAGARVGGHPPLAGLDGGRARCGVPARDRHRHLRVVRAG